MKMSILHDRQTAERIESLLRELLAARKDSGVPPHPDIAVLSPRRQEIVHMVRDHRQVSFDFLSRNFRGVRPRTLHYDLQQLVRKGYIRKQGATRGAMYVPG